jgi:hypothetical protein
VHVATTLREGGENLEQNSARLRIGCLLLAPADPPLAEAGNGFCDFTSLLGATCQSVADVKEKKYAAAEQKMGIAVTATLLGAAVKTKAQETHLSGPTLAFVTILAGILIDKAAATTTATAEENQAATQNSASNGQSSGSSTAPATPPPAVPKRATGTDQADY